MAIALRQSTASQKVLLGPFVDSTDGNTAENALTINNTDIKLFKHNGSAIVNKNSGGATFLTGSSGLYQATFDATDTNTLGDLWISVHPAGALAVLMLAHVYPSNIFDSWFGSDKQEVDIDQVNGVTITGNGSGTPFNV